ncbi:MAG: hypothetical protein Q4G13_02180 [Moraxella sp.]|nr:hypothetical protein [Moraxella sp.]
MTDTNPSTPATPNTPAKRRPYRWLLFALLLMIAVIFIWQPFGTLGTTQPSSQTPIISADPIVYDVENWTLAQTGDLAHATRQLGAAGVQDTGLDVEGNAATVIRYHALSEPLLSLIQSDKFIELRWYYAAATDSTGDKSTSLNHAKKAYAFASAYLGKTGHSLIQSILSTPNKDFGGLDTRIHSAQCTHYTCQIVLYR